MVIIGIQLMFLITTKQIGFQIINHQKNIWFCRGITMKDFEEAMNCIFRIDKNEIKKYINSAKEKELEISCSLDDLIKLWNEGVMNGSGK